jgi:carbonic anhydrase/acetyltransferase-like protein (isoleucine patch superfamily)
MNRTALHSGIRPNPVGDRPVVDPTAFVDPSAQIIGNVHIGPNVYVACQTVIRADEPDKEGRVHPIVIGAETNIQDGVVIHSKGGSSVTIGARSSIAHGALIHGPCTIGEGCFLAVRAVLYSATLEDNVWVGIGAIILKATVSSHIIIPAGAVIRTARDVLNFRLTNTKEEEYKEKVFAAANAIRKGYMGLYGSGVLIQPAGLHRRAVGEDASLDCQRGA